MILTILLVFVFLCLFLILFVPIKISCGAHLNVVLNKGFYCIKVWFIKILCGRLQVKDMKLEFENNNDLLFKKNKDEKYINRVFINLLQKLKLIELEVFIEFGYKKNAAVTALVCGTLQSIWCSVYSMLNCRFEKAYQFLDIDTKYNKDCLETTFSAMISISLFKIFVSIIKAKKEVEEKYEGRK